MSVVDVRELLNLSPEEIYDDLPKGTLLAKCDDGEIHTTRSRLTYSRVFWKVHEQYAIPLKTTHVLQKDVLVTKHTHGTIINDIYATLRLFGFFNTLEDREHIDRLIYGVVNDINTKIYSIAEEYMIPLSGFDYRLIMLDEDIKYINQQANEGVIDAVEAKKRIKQVILTKDKFKKSPIRFVVMIKSTKVDQLLSIIGPVGKRSDATAMVYKYPITTGYYNGLSSLYDVCAESSTAARALAYQQDDLGQVEYMARRSQLNMMVVSGIVKGDCGSKKYLEIKVNKGEGFDMLPSLIGKYYYDPSIDALQVIKEGDTHLYGETLQLRSAHKCQLKDPTQVCSTCFGELYYNLFTGGNLGVQTISQLNASVAGKVLKEKHHASTDLGSLIKLDDRATSVLERREHSFLFYFKKSLKLSKNAYLKFKAKDIRGLNDIVLSKDVRRLDIYTISWVMSVGLVDEENGLDVFFDIVPKKAVHLSEELVRYVNRKRYTISDSNRIIIHLDEWDFNSPVFRAPAMEYKMSLFADEIASLLESKKSLYWDRVKKGRYDSVLLELYNLVNKKMTINIAITEVAIYAMMCDGLTTGLARHSDNPTLGILSEVLKNRSLSAQLAYESHRETYRNSRNYFQENRPDSAYDVLVSPEEWFKYNAPE